MKRRLGLPATRAVATTSRRTLGIASTIIASSAIVLTSLALAHVTYAAAPEGATPVELRQLLDRGQYADVERRARVAYASYEREGGAKSASAAQLLDILVVALWRGGKASQQEAVDLAERAIDTNESLFGPEAPAVATSLDNAGVLFFVRGDYERALRSYERALAIFEASAANDARYKQDQGKVHSHLGPLFQELGQYSTARYHYERSLAILLETAGSADAQVAMARNNLATLMTKIGDNDAALRLYRESLSGLERQLGPEHPLIATSKHNLAELNQRIGRDGEAIELYRQSAALKEKTLGPAHPSLALTLGNLSYLYTDRGEIDAAESLAKRALDIHERALGARHVDLVYSLISLGRAQAARGDTAAARQTLTRALELRSEVLGPDNPLLVPPLYFLSETLLASGAPREAFELALRAEGIAREHLRLTARGAPERQALRYAEERLSGLDAALSIAANLQVPAMSQRGWDALIRSRAVVLDEMATRHRLATRQTDPAVRAAFDQYRTASERLANVLLRGPGTADIDQYRRRVDTLRTDKERAERAVATASTTVRLDIEEQAIGYEAARDALPANATLVAFARISRSARSNSQAGEYIALVLDDAGALPRIVALGDARKIESAIRRWRDEMVPHASGTEEAPYRQVGAQLRELIWDPLRISPVNDRLVLIVPAGALHLVNFAALPSRDGRFFAEAHLLIHYLSSERDLIVGDAITTKQQLLIVGAASASRETKDERPTVAGDCRILDRADLPPLPGSQREARRIASIWQATTGREALPVVELSDASATKPAFKRHAEGKSIVHVAAHGFFIANQCLTDDIATPSPLRLSGLVFSVDPKEIPTGVASGILLAEEVATLDFSHAQWIVLSGCDTGLGQIQVDEGVLGLRRAFRIAGARTLVMSLWPAEDRSTERFMSSLYQTRLSARRSTAVAMRQAYRDALADAKRTHGNAHPLYWAPFVASGDWR